MRGPNHGVGSEPAQRTQQLLAPHRLLSVARADICVDVQPAALGAERRHADGPARLGAGDEAEGEDVMTFGMTAGAFLAFFAFCSSCSRGVPLSPLLVL